MSLVEFDHCVSLAQARKIIRPAFEGNLREKKAALALVGGPASGSDLVAEATLADLARQQWAVMGMRQGFFDLMYRDPLRENAHYVSLDKPGSLADGLLTTSRENPLMKRNGSIDSAFIANNVLDPENHVMIITVINKLLALGASVLILQGGDGTLSLTYCLNRLGFLVVHVIKSVDDDYILFPDDPQAGHTYGFESAVKAIQPHIISAKEDAQSENTIIFLQCLGRGSGAIAYQAAVDGEVHGVWAAEDVAAGETLHQFCVRIADFIVDRRKRGIAHAVVVLSENLAIRFEGELGKLKRDRLLNPRPSTVNIGAIIAKRVEKIYRKKWAKISSLRDRVYRMRNEGCMFTCRVVPRKSMSIGDRTYCRGLGSAIAKLVLTGQFGTSARWDPVRGTSASVPIRMLVNPQDGTSIKRMVAPGSSLYHAVQQLREAEKNSKPLYPFSD
ncbi:MAG: 6-phosphofructokinase [Candidatus Margulisiibacteriota bacterium]